MSRKHSRPLSKAEIVRRLEKATEAEDVLPGVLGMLGNPVTFAARWGLPLSKSYIKFKEQQRRAAKRRRRAPGSRTHDALKASRQTPAT